MLFRCLATIQTHEQLQPALPSSAFAVAAAVRTSCSSAHLNFSGHFDCKGLSSMRPSMELLSLCSDLVRESDRKLLHKISLTIYARTPECYGGDALEFRKLEDELLLLFTSDIKGTFREVEEFLAQRGAIELPDFNALVVPLTKELCLVGLLVAERVSNAFEGVPPPIDDENSVIDLHPTSSVFSITETEELVRLAQTLASACVMDQRVALLQHASWQKSFKVDSLLEQTRGSLTALRTLGKLLLPHVRKGEIARDILQDMLLQSDRIKDVVEEIQEVLYRSMAMCDQDDETAFDSSEDWKAPQRQLQSGSRSSHIADKELRDSEAPMPPLTLAAIDSCVVAEVICELGQAGNRLASKKKIQVEVRVEAGAETLAAAVDEEALRQAVSKLLDNAIRRTKGGSDAWIRVKVSEAPGSGGVLVVIEDNGIDMSMVMQSRAMGRLGPAIKEGISLGLDLKLARELLECYGAVLRITSPFLRRLKNAGGGMRVEIWLPSSPELSKLSQTEEP